jgi:hypothetical protein
MKVKHDLEHYLTQKIFKEKKYLKKYGRMDP